MESVELSVLRYKDKEVGYRLKKGLSEVDVSKEDLDNLGGVDYSTVNYIELYESGKLIASEEEINSGKYVVNVTDKDTISKLYDTYKNSLGGSLIGDKYVLKVCTDDLFKGIEVYKIGQKELLTSFYVTTDYKDILYSVDALCNDLGLLGVEVEDYGDSVSVKLEGVTLYSLDYDNDIDLLLYNVRYLVLKLIKTMSSGVVC